MLLLLKLFLTPGLIIGLTLVARRSGPRIAGWLGGLPISAGPIALFLAIEQGATFAAQAAVTTIASIAATALYCLVYARVAQRRAWPIAVLGAFVCWGGAVVVLHWLAGLAWFGLATAVVLTCGCVWISLRAYPTGAAGKSSQAPAGDLWLRIAATWAILFIVTFAAQTLGPSWTGLFTTFPVVSTILAIFAHRQITREGVHPQPAQVVSALLRGIVLGIGSTIGFFVALNLLLPRQSLFVSFGTAIAVALALQGLSWLWLNAGKRVAPA